MKKTEKILELQNDLDNLQKRYNYLNEGFSVYKRQKRLSGEHKYWLLWWVIVSFIIVSITGALTYSGYLNGEEKLKMIDDNVDILEMECSHTVNMEKPFCILLALNKNKQ